MTSDLGARWIAFAGKRSLADVDALGLSDVQLQVLGAWLSENGVLNPPRDRPVKVGEFVCHCGCGQTFRAEYRTTKPKFLSNAHRMRWWRAKWREEGG